MWELTIASQPSLAHTFEVFRWVTWRWLKVNIINCAWNTWDHHHGTQGGWWKRDGYVCWCKLVYNLYNIVIFWVVEQASKWLLVGALYCWMVHPCIGSVSNLFCMTLWKNYKLWLRHERWTQAAADIDCHACNQCECCIAWRMQAISVACSSIDCAIFRIYTIPRGRVHMWDICYQEFSTPALNHWSFDWF